jgi:hypothetical protein
MYTLDDFLSGELIVHFEKYSDKEHNMRLFQEALHDRGITWSSGASLLDKYYFDSNNFRYRTPEESGDSGLVFSGSGGRKVNFSEIILESNQLETEDISISLSEDE